MNPGKVSQMMTIAILVVCLLFQQTAAVSLTKDLLLLSFLAKILKPRFVPLPIPLPFPLKFTKNTHKAYAVPLHSHSVSAHEVGHLPLSHGLSGPSYGGASYGAASYGGASYGGASYGGASYGGASYGGASYGKLPSYSHGVSSLDYAELKAIEKFLAQLDLKEKLKNSASHDLSSISDLSDGYSKLNEIHSSDSISDDDHSDLLYGSTSNIDSSHDDIEKIGGLDLLTDLDGLGSSKKWW